MAKNAVDAAIARLQAEIDDRMRAIQALMEAAKTDVLGVPPTPRRPYKRRKKAETPSNGD